MQVYFSFNCFIYSVSFFSFSIPEWWGRSSPLQLTPSTHVYNYIYVTIAEYCCDGLMARRKDAHGIIHSWVIILIFNVKGAKGYLLFCRIYKVQVLLGGKGPMVRGMESKKRKKRERIENMFWLSTDKKTNYGSHTKENRHNLFISLSLSGPFPPLPTSL